MHQGRNHLVFPGRGVKWLELVIALCSGEAIARSVIPNFAGLIRVIYCGCFYIRDVLVAKSLCITFLIHEEWYATQVHALVYNYKIVLWGNFERIHVLLPGHVWFFSYIAPSSVLRWNLESFNCFTHPGDSEILSTRFYTKFAIEVNWCDSKLVFFTHKLGKASRNSHNADRNDSFSFASKTQWNDVAKKQGKHIWLSQKGIVASQKEIVACAPRRYIYTRTRLCFWFLKARKVISSC